MDRSAQPQSARERGSFGQSSDGVRQVDEAVLDSEALGHELAQPAHAERLGGVVASSDEVHVILARVGHHVLGRFAGEKAVQTERDRVGEARRRGPGQDAQAVYDLGAGVPDERRAAEGVLAAVAQLGEGIPSR